MKQNHLLKSLLLLCALIVGSMNVWAAEKTLTFVQSSATAGTLTNAPTGVTATFKNTYTSNKEQITGGNSMTLTLSGWDANTTIKGVQLSVRNNASSGNGTATVKIGATTIGTLEITGLGNTYIDKDVTITPTKTTEDLVITIAATQNSVFCNKFSVTYEETAPAGTTATPIISGETPFFSTSTVTIANDAASDGATIYYTTDGTEPTTGSSVYSVPFVISSTTTVKAIAKHADDTYASSVAEKTFTKVMTVAEAIDAIDASAGTTDVYVRGIVCEGGSNLSGGAMNYWISDDGTETKKFEIYKGKGLNAASFTSTDDVNVGDIVVVFGNITKYSSTYEFSAGSQLISHIKKVEAPTFSPAAGAVAEGTTVTISTTTDGATIYYTTDGSTPTTSSSVYSLPITIDAAKTINAFAVKDGCPDSDIATAAYTIAVPAATPTFSLAEGTYTEVKTVAIATTTDGATIYYTTDGSTPTTESTEYTSEITVDETMTIKAIAAKDGMANSAVASVTYTINLPDYVTLPFSFDDGQSSLPTGMTSSGLGTYASSPKLKFDDTGDYLIMKTNETIGTLAFKIKGNSFSGGTFKVQYSVDGSSYSDLASYTTLGDIQVEIFNNVPDDARYIKWIYTLKKSGNVGLGEINVQKYVSITPAKTYTTLTSDYALDFTGTTIKAFIVKDNDASDGQITMTEVSKVPANTGLVLKATTPGAAVDVPTLAGDADDVSGNLMKGSATETTEISANGGYILSEGKFHPATAGTLPAGKAYLALSVTAPELVLSFDDDNTEGQTTGIDTIEHSTLTIEHSEVYNLNGQRVSQPTKGLYIVNGKKVIVK